MCGFIERVSPHAHSSVTQIDNEMKAMSRKLKAGKRFSIKKL